MEQGTKRDTFINYCTNAIINGTNTTKINDDAYTLSIRIKAYNNNN